MNSNTANQVYVIGSVDTSDKNSKTGVISVHSVAFYEGNHIKYTVDVKYDTSGKVSSYKVNGGEGTTHAHKWIEVKPGIWGRKSGAKNNHLPPDSRWSQDLIKAIEAFNAKKIKVKYGD